MKELTLRISPAGRDYYFRIKGSELVFRTGGSHYGDP